MKWLKNQLSGVDFEIINEWDSIGDFEKGYHYKHLLVKKRALILEICKVEENGRYYINDYLGKRIVSKYGVKEIYSEIAQLKVYVGYIKFLNDLIFRFAEEHNIKQTSLVESLGVENSVFYKMQDKYLSQEKFRASFGVRDLMEAFVLQKIYLNEYKESKKITKEQERDTRYKYVFSNMDFKLLGIKIKDMEWQEENLLFVVRQGVCRVSLDRMYLAMLDANYKKKLEKDIQFHRQIFD